MQEPSVVKIFPLEVVGIFSGKESKETPTCRMHCFASQALLSRKLLLDSSLIDSYIKIRIHIKILRIWYVRRIIIFSLSQNQTLAPQSDVRVETAWTTPKYE